MIRFIFILLGTVSLIIGLIGIVVPGVPTTPFVLLTAGLYIKSSDRLYKSLVANRLIGTYIRDFYTLKGMTRRTKIQAIASMWLMIAISFIFFIATMWIRIAIITIGLAGTLVMGLVVKTVNINRRDSREAKGPEEKEDSL